MKNYRIIGRSLEFQEDAITTYIIVCIELNLINLCKTIVQNIYTTAERIQWLCTAWFNWEAWSTGTLYIVLTSTAWHLFLMKHCMERQIKQKTGCSKMDFI